MTKQPWSVQADDSVAVAREMLAERRAHHLPVLDGGKLVGLVTARELARPGNGHATPVEQVMTAALEVDASTTLTEALAAMLDRGRDAVVITRDGAIEGIFTAMDAVRVLYERHHRPPAHEPRRGA